jgi:hypothetical protein
MLLKGVIKTRYMTHAGLAPEKVRFLEEGGFEVDELDTGNVLRPEAMESLYYMWRLTGEQKYREWGWDTFKAFQEHAKGEAGYHALLVRALSTRELQGSKQRIRRCPAFPASTRIASPGFLENLTSG